MASAREHEMCLSLEEAVAAMKLLKGRVGIVTGAADGQRSAGTGGGQVPRAPAGRPSLASIPAEGPVHYNPQMPSPPPKIAFAPVVPRMTTRKAAEGGPADVKGEEWKTAPSTEWSTAPSSAKPGKKKEE